MDKKWRTKQHESRHYTVLVRVSIGCIRAYRFLFSPDHGILFPNRVRTCRFYPSCSEFAVTAFIRHGFLSGLWYSVKRVSACHPWQEGGYNPVPEKQLPVSK